MFDQGLNPAVTWTGYWTPLRYVLLFKVSALFDMELLRRAWAARIEKNSQIAERELVSICETLRSRVALLPDARSRTLIEDALRFVEAEPSAVHYNATDKNMLYQITPNLIGFQFVMCAVARRLKKTGAKNPVVVVDQQAQFNKTQRSLAEHYVLLSEASPLISGPGLPALDFSGMPDGPIQFASSATSAGLELTDLYLWVFKRLLEQKEIPGAWIPIIQRQLTRGNTDEISLDALAKRWTKHFEELPEPTEEQIQRGREIVAADEERRLKAIAHLKSLDSPSNT